MSDEKKILVVSQNIRFLNNIGNRLTRCNYVVKGTRARDGELFNALSDVGPDLTIFDAPLASIDAVRQLLGIRNTVDIPIVMLSTQGAKADTVQTLTISSCSHPALKSLTFEQLTDQINGMLGKV